MKNAVLLDVIKIVAEHSELKWSKYYLALQFVSWRKPFCTFVFKSRWDLSEVQLRSSKSFFKSFPARKKCLYVNQTRRKCFRPLNCSWAAENWIDDGIYSLEIPMDGCSSLPRIKLDRAPMPGGAVGLAPQNDECCWRNSPAPYFPQRKLQQIYPAFKRNIIRLYQKVIGDLWPGI